MNFMGRVFNSVTDLYNDVNPRRMCGANDVIVVKTGRGYESTGFYARFERRAVKQSKEVILMVNEKVINVDIRLDEEGNLYFSFAGSPLIASEPLDYLSDTGYKRMGALIESTRNYAYLLSHYEKISSLIINHKYVFSECLNRRIEPKKVIEVFNQYKSSVFVGSDTMVVGLGEEENVEYLLSFSLFSELYFSVERRIKEEKTKSSTVKHLIKQILRKRAKPIQNQSASEKEVFLPEPFLKEMCLKPGANKTVYRVSGTSIALTCTIFLWDSTEKIVISDIDGTITKSDVIGYIYGAMGLDWTHKGIAALYNRIEENGYKIVYISSRPIGHIGITKSYLAKVEQNEQKLPVGPVILFPGRLFSAIYREMILGPEEYKISIISEIKQLMERGDIFAGFGNKENDRIAYQLCEVDRGRIFIINALGDISTGKNGLVKMSHDTLYEMSEGVFPPIRKK
ncbi:phosphatidate phosphatase LPIN [Nematocida sp. LUAm3]|nr:phosphatidate phosphatase LPIN [Nematocida sp. LUAm3]KAI5175783.1 phosphatidate phosphatase LPIN [Nematocida sp. LUAm2]KAI5178279.1 phosphatidate phosphatase LPIN [Nematocida sp. LUAm1]